MVRRFGTALIAGVLLSALVAVPAQAAAVGYCRLAHLSPDTPAVDVYVSSVTGAVETKVFKAVGYGVVSKYYALPVGTYAVAMRQVGAAPTSPPVLSTQATIEAGRAVTVAGVGKYADLGLRVIPDDLSAPPAGRSKVRIVQASVRAPVLDVAVAQGRTIATDVQFATTTPYQEVGPGRWTLALTPDGGAPSNVSCDLRADSIYSLIVLDGKNGNLQVELRLDGRGASGVPVGGVGTGGGGTAAPPADERWLPVALGMALLLAGGLGLALRRLRRARAASRAAVLASAGQ